MEVEIQWRFEHVGRIEPVLGEIKLVHVGVRIRSR
jgi:rRNA processing protein Gar1